MGEALLSGLVTEVLRGLTSVAMQEFSLLSEIESEVSNLRVNFYQIQDVLQDAEEKHQEKSVELWLKSLRSASLQIENVLDEVSTEAMLRRLHKELGIKYSVKAFFSSDHNRVMFRVRIAHKVKAVRKKLDAITAKRSELNLNPAGAISSVAGGVVSEMPNRETSSLIHSSIVYGRNEEIEMVIKKICNTDICKNDVDDIRVFAIWGMGGLGKTTLAQLVYNHERVNKHFELKCWRYVSEKFQVKELIRGIIESIHKAECRLSQLDDIQVCLQDKLQGKRFLVVLDDVWIEESEKTKWEELSKTLSCGAHGSIVLMTTRSKITSRMMARVSELQHELGCLSNEDSWSLFKKLAFAEGREGGDIRELEPIGKKIVEKCKGLPLAVKTLGGLMWSKSSTSDWERVMDSNIWDLQENDILPALKLSYNNLLPHLKRCFAYCCLFPKGYDMQKDVLIQLWVANGFIPRKGETDLYVLGEEIVSCLVWKSFFQVVCGKYKIHDLMHDLARYVMRHDCSIIEPGKELITPDEVLHLSSSCPDFLIGPQDLEKLKYLRSIFMFKIKYEFNIGRIFDHVYLRVLYLVGINSATLPESICKLKHLRYLNLSNSRIKVLPESIIYLQNLQALLLEGCINLRKLPERMRYMRNLQILENNACVSLLYLPVGIQELTSLRRLPHFCIGNKNGAQIGELRDLNLLGGDLVLSGLENVAGVSDAKTANLKNKINLMGLILSWPRYDLNKSKPETCAHDEEVLEGLQPNPGLKELKISYYTGKFPQSWIVNLRNLVKIEFWYCDNCEHIPPLGKLPSLSVIKLHNLEILKCFHDEDDTKSGDGTLFPSLQELDVIKCSNLVCLPSNLPNLTKLHIDSCPSLSSLPDEIQRFKDLKELEIYGCKILSKRCEEETGVDWPKISHIPSISIYPQQ